MLTLFIVLAALGFTAAIVGAVWWVVSSGQMRTRSGQDVGAEIMAGLGEEDEEGEQLEVYSASKQVFKGTGIETKGEMEMSFGDMKRQMAAGRWREVLPPLLAALGLLASVVFGSLAALVGLEDKLVGGLIAAVALFTVARIIRDFAKA